MKPLLTSLFIGSCLLTHPLSAQEASVMIDMVLQQMDVDEDGKIAKSEASGLMARFFDRNDLNSDGMMDRDELEILGKRLAARDQQNRNAAALGPSDEQVLATVPNGVKAHLNLAYREGESDRGKLDLFVPEGASDTPRPAVIFVHGGGWRSGDKRKGTFLNGAIEYAEKGYVTATINYRLTGEAPFPACIEDVKCAVRWLRYNAGKYKVDISKIGGYGNSAGAHLVSMLGLAGSDAGLEGDGPYQDESSLIQAVCASATPTDFSLFGWDPSSDSRWAAPGYEPAKLAKLSSPIHHVSAEAPPFLLIHGTKDTTVNVRHGDDLAKALKEAGAEDVTYIRIEGAGHGVYGQHREKTHPAMEAFFERVLKGE
ncbi:MAG: alpha/beta hydrolase fold domain-containing protein [Verrucomicrobiota bacterium]